MKKLLMFCAMLVFCIPVLVSCREQTPKSLLTVGEEVVAMMAEMTQSESYAALYNLPAAYSETAAECRNGNYEQAESVCRLTVPQKTLFDPNIKLDAYSENLSAYLEASMYVSFATQVNQTVSVDALAVSSVYCAQKTFVGEPLSKPVIYLYTFADGFPIAVAFLPGDNGAIRAIGNFLLHQMPDTDSAERIEQAFADIGITGVKAELLSS